MKRSPFIDLATVHKSEICTTPSSPVANPPLLAKKGNGESINENRFKIAGQSSPNMGELEGAMRMVNGDL